MVIFRGEILHFLDSPLAVANTSDCYQYLEDGLLVVNDGVITDLLPYSQRDPLLHQNIIDYRGYLITPGFIDSHIHYPQSEIIASYGEQLLEWLKMYVFPAEEKFSDKTYARKIVNLFLDELVKNGTTTAGVFATVFSDSVDAFFEQAEKRNMRMLCGKVMMDRNIPKELSELAEVSYEETQRLINKWHGRGRLLYSVTPRFALSSSPELLEVTGDLLKHNPGVYLQTHLSENQQEVSLARKMFPHHKNYLDIYHSYGLTGSRSLFAHSICLEEEEWKLMADTDSVAIFCPTSNLFLGSGLFDMKRAKESKIRVGLGTDIGAGTSFSLLNSLHEAYKVCQLKEYKLSALKGFYLATLGNARALSLDSYIGNFKKGKEADFVVWNWAASDIQKLRLSHSSDPEDKLFSLMMLGDDRNVRATYVSGKKMYSYN